VVVSEGFAVKEGQEVWQQFSGDRADVDRLVGLAHGGLCVQ
jgi:hypothetical protein